MTDPLEQRLAATPPRELPAAWRRDILAAATERASAPPWWAFSWPRLGWASLATAWLVILALNFSGPRGTELYAVTPPELRDRLPAPSEYLAYKQRERTLLLALAADAPPEPGPLRPRPWEL